MHETARTDEQILIKFDIGKCYLPIFVYIEQFWRPLYITAYDLLHQILSFHMKTDVSNVSSEDRMSKKEK
jgi:hypothetical protein